MIIKTSLNYFLMKFNQIIKHPEIKCLLVKVTSGHIVPFLLSYVLEHTRHSINIYRLNKLILVLSLH